MHGPHPTAGLWWAAVVIGLSGGVITYVVAADKMNPSSQTMAALSGTITIIAAGLCVIGATANWWLKR